MLVTFSISGCVVTTEQQIVLAKHNAESHSTDDGMVFRFKTDKLSLADADEIVDIFGHVYLWGHGRTASHRFKGEQWDCVMSNHNWVMVPGFDNSPTYNVESVELCLL